MSIQSNLLEKLPNLRRDCDFVAVWGGTEFTCNRVGDRYFDQTELSGDGRRRRDFDAFASLGISTLRIGLLWERYERFSWAWSDSCVARLREANIRPIAGLMHHGSGPSDNSLLDPDFPRRFAAYAAAVAERYPWIDAYVPINEPNTTARFSGLYGIWYPHHQSRASYLRALLNQLRATVLAMEAIRRVRPDAQFVQTDDAGVISGTEELRPIWELLNLRQWLTFDFLGGLVDRHHPMFDYIRGEGISEREILWFADRPCLPDIIGLNYYVTSDRYIDHRLELFPSDRISGEGRFVDVETVRVRAEGIAGFRSVLLDAWDRYGIPVAITEVHMGCEVDEQIRWLAEAWRAAKEARHLGVDCIAITVWALLGSFFWNELVTCENGHYEPGVFDITSGELSSTPLADVVRQIATGSNPQHRALSRPGWWREIDRICHPCVQEDRLEGACV